MFFKLFPGYHVRDNLEIPGRGSKVWNVLYRGGVDIKCNKPIARLFFLTWMTLNLRVSST